MSTDVCSPQTPASSSSIARLPIPLIAGGGGALLLCVVGLALCVRARSGKAGKKVVPLESSDPNLAAVKAHIVVGRDISLSAPV